ncbi:poly(rC)-binding protein 2/3/4 [Dioscorea alata]|uniref:Poly(RC)-binding protein 2/3/4 n=1 Tax=Dioscorea alata TaxID=55571 RepID=A0ACB7WVR2_DIOAL|nr:poly(rC)-binding protein 2/3/4 [Dioscorea alata]
MSALFDDTSEDGSSPTSDAALDAEVVPSSVPRAEEQRRRWPGWPGDCVFRLVVPVLKVGGIIGRRGESIKKLCEETRARVRVLEGPVGSPDRIVLISAKEEPDEEVSPAMDAVIRVFKRANGIPENNSDGITAQSSAFIRLLVPSSQAISLIGKHGTLIKSIQENCGASVRVQSGDELPLYATMDERVVDIQGEPLKVLKGLEAVVGHLRKFLVDHSIIPLFEQNLKNQVSQERAVNAWGDNTQSLTHNVHHTGINNDYPHSLRWDPVHTDREPPPDLPYHPQDPHYQRSGLSMYGPDPSHSGLRSMGLGRSAGAVVSQISHTMQIPLTYAEHIIGVDGQNITYIRRASGAVLSVNESVGIPDEITVEIKGTSSQVQSAQRLIQVSNEDLSLYHGKTNIHTCLSFRNS